MIEELGYVVILIVKELLNVVYTYSEFYIMVETINNKSVVKLLVILKLKYICWAKNRQKL